MPLRAAAFHESISVEKLAELFKSDINQLFGGTTAAHCATCKAQFAVFFPNTDDKENINYLHELEKRITADCKKGKHTQEVILRTQP